VSLYDFGMMPKLLNKLVNLINYNLIVNQELDTDEREKKEKKQGCRIVAKT